VQQFEKEVSPVLSLPDFDPSLTTYIRDGMALVQCMKSPKKFMSACLFSLTYRNFFQSGIFLPSMTWNTFVWAVTLVRRSLSAGDPEIVNVVSDQEVFDCPDLYSTQEEADTV
jgi:hypothetical protein